MPDARAQRLTLLQQSTSRWIAGASHRHPVTLLIMTAVIVVAQFLGAKVNAWVYVVTAVWFVLAVLEGPWVEQARDFDSRRARYAGTLVVDAVMLGAAFYFVDAARVAGIAPFVLVLVSARVVLPTRWAQGIAVLVVAVYATLLMISVRAAHPVVSPVGLAPLTGNERYLVAAVVSSVAVIYLIFRMHAHVLRTVRDAEERHEAVVQAAADMIMVVDERGHIVEANAATLARSGYSWEELKELPNAALFPQDEWDGVLALFQAALGGESLERTVRVLTKQGRVVWVDATLAPVVLSDRPAVIVVARDVTERRRQEESLRQSEASLDLVLNTLNSGFYTIDRDQNITSVRGRGSDPSGGASRLVGKSIATIAPSPDQAVVQREQHERALAGEVATWVWPVGSGRWVRSHVAPIRDMNGEVTGAAGFWRDETAIVRAREEEDSRWSRFRPMDPMPTGEHPTPPELPSYRPPR